MNVSAPLFRVKSRMISKYIISSIAAESMSIFRIAKQSFLFAEMGYAGRVRGIIYLPGTDSIAPVDK